MFITIKSPQYMTNFKYIPLNAYNFKYLKNYINYNIYLLQFIYLI